MFYACVSCGRTIKPRFISGKWEKGTCECFRLALAESEEMKIQLRRERHAEMMRRVALGGINAGYQLENFDVAGYLVNRKALNAIKLYVRNLVNAAVSGVYSSLETRNLILYSSEPGVGKTMLAAGIINALVNEAVNIETTARYGDVSQMVADRVINARWFLSTDLNTIRLEKDDYDNTGTRFTSLLRRALWVVDDVGKEHIKEEWRHQLWWDIMDYRLTHQIPTVITTNLDPRPGAALERHMGTFAHDRIMEKCLPIMIQGETRRLQGVHGLGFGDTIDSEEEPQQDIGEQREAILPRQIRA